MKRDSGECVPFLYYDLTLQIKKRTSLGKLFVISKFRGFPSFFSRFLFISYFIRHSLESITQKVTCGLLLLALFNSHTQSVTTFACLISFFDFSLLNFVIFSPKLGAGGARRISLLSRLTSDQRETTLVAAAGSHEINK